jgi:hypothetical protein
MGGWRRCPKCLLTGHCRSPHRQKRWMRWTLKCGRPATPWGSRWRWRCAQLQAIRGSCSECLGRARTPSSRRMCGRSRWCARPRARDRLGGPPAPHQGRDGVRWGNACTMTTNTTIASVPLPVGVPGRYATPTGLGERPPSPSRPSTASRGGRRIPRSAEVFGDEHGGALAFGSRIVGLAAGEASRCCTASGMSISPWVTSSNPTGDPRAINCSRASVSVASSGRCPAPPAARQRLFGCRHPLMGNSIPGTHFYRTTSAATNRRDACTPQGHTILSIRRRRGKRARCSRSSPADAR